MNTYFNELSANYQSPDFNYLQFLKARHLPLLAKLIQDSQLPTSELIPELKAILMPLGSPFARLDWPFINYHFLMEFCERSSYGHPSAGNNFSAWSCTFWQVKDMNLLGGAIGRHFLTNFVLRQAARMMLENAIASSGSVLDDIEGKMEEIASIEESARIEREREREKERLEREALKEKERIEREALKEKERLEREAARGKERIERERQKAEAKAQRKAEREAERERMRAEKSAETPDKKKSPEDTPTKASTPIAAANIPKISSFFAKLKKPERKEDSTSNEYFQPFFVKPNVTLANWSALNEKAQLVQESSLPLGLKGIKLHDKKAKCRCVGLDGREVWAVLKLLKFEENYRPAYLGTWRKSPSPSLARNPFLRQANLDYEYDSDEEWEDEPEEGESLSDEEDEEEDSELSDAESVDVSAKRGKDQYSNSLSRFRAG